MMDWPLTDMHLHATHYRLSNIRPDMTVANIVRRLEASTYVVGGIVEHLEPGPKHPVDCLEAMVHEFRSVCSPVELFVGAELSYRGDAITFPEAAQVKRRLALDYCLAAAHGIGDGITSTAAFVEDYHRRLMDIVERCGYVDIIAHPWSDGHGLATRGLATEWHFECVPERYLREFVDAAKYHGKVIEVNRKVLADASDPAFARYLTLLREARVPLTVASDAHSMDQIGSTAPLNTLLQEAGLVCGCLWKPTAAERPAIPRWS